MAVEGFQFLDVTSNNNSIIQRDYIKKYHQQGAQQNHLNQKMKSFSEKVTFIAK